jgi:hypothetical protein
MTGLTAQEREAVARFLKRRKPTRVPYMRGPVDLDQVLGAVERRERICEHCGEAIQSPGTKKRYCGSACEVAARLLGQEKIP